MKRTGSALLSVAALLVTSIGLAACGSSSSTGATGSAVADGCPEGPIKFWVQMPYSGPVGTVGTAATDAIRAGVKVINAQGGVLGHDIELITEDSAGDPTKAVSNLQSMLSQSEKPTVVIPGLLSTETLAGLPLVTSAKVLSIVVTSNPETADAQKFPYTFNLGSTNATYAVPAAVDEMQGKGYKKVAVAASDDATGVANLEAVEAAAQDGGFTVTSVRIPPDTIDPIPQLSKLQADDPDLLVYATGPGPLTAATLTARQTMGWTVPAHGLPVSAGAAVSKLPAETTAGVTFTTPVYGVAGSEVQKTEAYKTYLTALEEQVGGMDKVTQTPEIYVNPYAMTIAGAAAIQKAGSCDTDKVVAAFQSLQVADVPLWFVTSAFGFSKDNHALAYAVDDYTSIPASSQLVEGSFVPPQ